MPRFRLAAVCLVILLSGCGQPVEERPEPISIESWQALPTDQRYNSEMLERLKEGNPALQTPEGWEAFNRTTLAATRRKDATSRRK